MFSRVPRGMIQAWARHDPGNLRSCPYFFENVQNINIYYPGMIQVIYVLARIFLKIGKT